jgi:hypothetical protein
MGMFDYYRPAGKQYCPVCGRPLREWQGKEGPNGLLVWVEKVAFPIDQLIDDDDVRLDQAARERLRLPPVFLIWSFDCPDHYPITADGKAPEGTWIETLIHPYDPQKRKNR